MSNELANIEKQSIQKKNLESVLTPEFIKNKICPEANDQEISHFLSLCRTHSMDPSIKDAYLVVYAGQNRRSSVIVSKDFFLKRLQRMKDFTGLKAGIIVQDENKNIHNLEGSCIYPQFKLIGGWAEIKRKEFECPFRTTVSLSEYSSGQSTWRNIPATMIRKVALVQCIREAYPSDFQGLNDESEKESIKNSAQPIHAEVPVEYISESQIKELDALINEFGADKKPQILQAYKIAEIKDLPAEKFDAVKERLLLRINQQIKSINAPVSSDNNNES